MSFSIKCFVNHCHQGNQSYLDKRKAVLLKCYHDETVYDKINLITITIKIHNLMDLNELLNYNFLLFYCIGSVKYKQALIK